MLSDLKTFHAALEQLEVERGVSKEKILETMELALAAAYKKDYGKRGQIIRAKFDITTGKTDFWQIKIVVDESMLKPEETEDDAGAELPETELKTKESGEERRPSRFEIEEEEEAPTAEKKVLLNPERHIMIDE